MAPGSWLRIGLILTVSVLSVAAGQLGSRPRTRLLAAALTLGLALGFVFTRPADPAARVLIEAALLSAGLAAISWRLRLLAPSGAVAAGLLATLLFAVGGWRWAGPMLAFFFLSSLLSKAGRRAKASAESRVAKGSTRDAGQVWANGGVAGLMLVGHAFWPEVGFYPAYLGALAAATADTWATEIGTWAGAGRPARSLLTGRLLEPGTSGGVTLVGTLGGLLGAATIAAIGRLSVPTLSAATVIGIVLAGTAGGALDSLLGATVQSVRRCSVCGEETEAFSHHDAPTAVVRGRAWLDNDGVNLACCLLGAAVGWLLSR